MVCNLLIQNPIFLAIPIQQAIRYLFFFFEKRSTLWRLNFGNGLIQFLNNLTLFQIGYTIWFISGIRCRFKTELKNLSPDWKHPSQIGLKHYSLYFKEAQAWLYWRIISIHKKYSNNNAPFKSKQLWFKFCYFNYRNSSKTKKRANKHQAKRWYVFFLCMCVLGICYHRSANFFTTFFIYSPHKNK